MKETSISTNDNSQDSHDKMNSFEKLVNVDGLSYLPNLYLKQYKAMDELARLRQDFPEQRVLLERPTTRWQHVLNEMKSRALLVGQVKKFRVAEKSHVARQAKGEVQRARIRSEEQTQFQRITGSILAQSVIEQWQEQSKQALKKEEPPPKVEEPPVNHPVIKVHQDDIFVDHEEQQPMPIEQDLFDDLLMDPPIREKIEEEPPNVEVAIEPIGGYLATRYEEVGEEVQKEPSVVLLRKNSVRKISENVRKRLKMREEEDELAGRSLNSATVLLSCMMKSELEWGRGLGIDASQGSDWGFQVERARGEERWELKWSQEELEKMDRKAEGGRRRVEEGMLALNVNAQDKDYERLFDKNISNDRHFPPSLRDVPLVANNEPQRYYNQFSDPAYEHFIIRFNKRRILKDFTDKANMIFPQSYSHEEVEETETISIGKIFVHPPEKVLERLVWRVNGFKSTAGVKSSINSFNVDFNRMVLLAFLVRKYLATFGNAWENVSQFVAMHPIFANHHLTPQLVQEVYQVISRLEGGSIGGQIELWDKKVLPYQHHYSYQNYLPYVPGSEPQKETSAMVAEEDTEEEEDFPFESYSKIIRQKVQQDTDWDKQAEMLEQEYKQYAHRIKENAVGVSMASYTETLSEEYRRICKVREKFRPKSEFIPYNPDFKPEDNTSKVTEELVACLKGQIKVGTPFRKKKNINERNNELVKILQALRNKTIPGGQVVANAKPNPEANKLTTSYKVTQPVAPAPAVKATEEARKTQRSPEKRLGGPSKGGRKSKDADDKK